MTFGFGMKEIFGYGTLCVVFEDNSYMIFDRIIVEGWMLFDRWYGDEEIAWQWCRFVDTKGRIWLS